MKITSKGINSSLNLINKHVQKPANKPIPKPKKQYPRRYYAKHLNKKDKNFIHEVPQADKIRNMNNIKRTASKSKLMQETKMPKPQISKPNHKNYLKQIKRLYSKQKVEEEPKPNVDNSP